MVATLGAVAAAMRDARDPWWIIGSAAVALHGGSPIDVADVDLLCSADDALEVINRLGLVQTDDAKDPLFCSAVFARWGKPPLQVELMAGFHVRVDDFWQRVWPVTRETIAIGNCVVAVPSRVELRELLLTFGREKDLLRAKLLA